MQEITADTDWAFTQYERVRHLLPSASFPDTSQNIANLGDIADQFDVFLLDAFGVLNVGDTPIKGAPEQVAALQAAGKKVMVLTNGAGMPLEVALQKYKRFGFDFTAENVIASREILAMSLPGRPAMKWGAMAMPASKLDGLGVDVVDLGVDRPLFDAVDGFILLSAATWTDQQQEILTESLLKNPRPVLVGNPDIIAPRENDFSLEPGWFIHEIIRTTGIAPEFFGKPFDGIFAEARRRIPTDIPDHRIVMVGDTLHTDILGGKAAGFGTVLIEDHGLFAGKDTAKYIAKSGIQPDFIAPTT
ncbi:MAG: HAD-IIA family hydrolase [Rhodobacteraceae bacterium]|nr:HAD-IIA family hydrolase [Paracoccaceae bacterium]